jgi:hypothetical protein
VDRKLETLVVLIKAISAGIIVLVTLACISIFILNFTTHYKVSQEPASLYPGLEILVRFQENFLPLYILSTCIASFISGYLLKAWGTETDARAWQSLISGFIVGGSVPFFLIFNKIRRFLFLVFFPQNLFFVNGISVFSYCLFMALMGFLGYYVASHKHSRQVSE